MKKTGIKLKAWNFVVFAVMAIFIAAMIVADCLCKVNAQAITNLLCGRGIRFDGEDVEQAMAESDALVRNICEEGIVMLKNEGGKDGKGVLPLAEDNRKINLFGWSSTDNGFLLTGFGSGAATIHAAKKVSLSAGLKEQGFTVNTELLDKYEQYKSGREDKMESDDPFALIEPARDFYDDDILRGAREFSDTALITFTRNGGESIEMPTWQRKYKLPTDTSRTYLQLSTEEEALIDVVAENFDKVIVIINTANPMELGFLDDDRIDAALNVGFLGQSGTNAIGKILKGEVSPSGRTVDTYAYDWRSAPSYANKLKNGGDASYTENIYIGYKWYETAFADKLVHEAYGKTFDYSTEEGYNGIVKYPFGFGLSYTNFTWTVNSAKVIADDEEVNLENSQINVKNARIEVDVSVTNTGDRAGRETVQLYASAPYTNGIEKPALSLMDFEKTIVLYPAGEVDADHPGTQNLLLSFDLYDLASYDCYDANGNGVRAYELDAGTYNISLRNNAHEVNSCDDSIIEFSLPDALNYKRDPKTKRIVKNRFTGEDDGNGNYTAGAAYAGVPIDGSTVGAPINYVTRKNFAGTFPVESTSQRTSKDVIKTASRYIFDGYEGVAKPDYGIAGDLRIWTREDGSDATADDLKGTSGVALKLNEQLVTALGSNYNAAEWDGLLNQITLSELFTLVESSGYCNDEMTSIGKAYHRDPDGPSGFLADYGALVDTSKWSGFPSETIIGASFSKALAFQFGRAVGNEGATTGISGWYAPAVNLHRTPYNGRYFEYYSEDSALSGYMGAYVIKGAASANLYCYLKHFALSEMGINPKDVNVWITEQALRETYLRPFEIAVKDGGANAIMSAFNNIGATWAGGNKALLTDILRTEWGFRGTVITDWSTGDALMPPDQGIRAGNDIWLNPNDDATKPLDRSDPVNVYLARNSAHNMLYTICNTYVRYKDYDPADGEFAASVGIRNMDKVFPWWIPVLVALNVVVFGIIIFETVWILLKGRKRYKLALEAAESGTTLEALEKAERDRERAARNDSVVVSDAEPAPPPLATVYEDFSENDKAEKETAYAIEPTAAAEQNTPAAITPKNEEMPNVAKESDEEKESLISQNAALKAEIAQLRQQIDAYAMLASELKQEREKRLDAARKRREAAKEKPKTERAPSAKQQIDELKKEIEEIKNMLNK